MNETIIIIRTLRLSNLNWPTFSIPFNANQFKFMFTGALLHTYEKTRIEQIVEESIKTELAIGAAHANLFLIRNVRQKERKGIPRVAMASRVIQTVSSDITVALLVG
jgi:hypothetical protein